MNIKKTQPIFKFNELKIIQNLNTNYLVKVKIILILKKCQKKIIIKKKP